MSLSKSEEQLMQLLWSRQKAFINDLIEDYPDPKPAITTVATLLKRMQDKDFVSYSQKGRAREYFPTVAKEAYFAKQMKGMIKHFFNDSTTQFASFFTQEANMSKAELQKLKSIIDQEIKKK